MEREQVVLKLQVDGGKNRVLFAECGSDFVDLLFALLTLPLSTIIRLTHNRPKLGSISKLYESLAKLDGGSFHSANAQAMLLSAYSKPDAGNEDDENSFCDRFYCKACERGRWVSTLGNAPCDCGGVMDVPYLSKLPAKRERGKRNFFVGEGLRFVVTDDREGGKRNVFVGEGVTDDREGGKRNVFVGEGLRFVVTDDLRVMPVSLRSTFSLLHELGIEDCTSFRNELVTVGVEELLNLLRHSLVSKQPLTDAFLQQPSVVLDPLPSFKLVEKARPLKETKLSYVMMDVNVELKLFFDKSLDTMLYAEAGEDFVDLVFSFMTFPLGCVVKLLDGNSDVGCIDNLTNSIEILEKEKYMKHGVEERKVIHLKHNIGFHLQDLALPLAEQLQIPLYARGEFYKNRVISEVDIMSNKKFMRGPANFVIMNNLEIVPASVIAGLSMLMERRVSLNDVQERVLKIGQVEALDLLKASLQSESALSDFFQAMRRTET